MMGTLGFAKWLGLNPLLGNRGRSKRSTRRAKHGARAKHFGTFSPVAPLAGKHAPELGKWKYLSRAEAVKNRGKR